MLALFCLFGQGFEKILKGKNMGQKYFGTDGFRGEANVTLFAEHAYRIGRFLGWYYREGDLCVKIE